MSIGPVDFLVAVAVKEELAAVKKHLRPTLRDGKLVATVERANSARTVTVAVLDIAGMGPSLAQAEVSRALSELRPARVLLVGIAAGFPERGIGHGDVMVPYALVLYDLSKVTTNAGGDLLRQYRTVPVPVSEPLWRAAYDIATADEVNWAASVTAPRPDGSEGPPAVHCARTTLLGSGSQLTAAEKAEVRRWLLECMAPETKYVVVGLEMEGAGAWQACRAVDKPFLLLKAMQDDATERKEVDEQGWREYAADASAALAVEVIREFEPSAEDPVAAHLREAARTAGAFEERMPKPRFERTVRRADTIGLLRSGIFAARGLPPVQLVPDAAHPTIRLHGEGGAGKSTVVRGILQAMLGAGLVPVFLDLGEYALAPPEEARPPGSSLEALIRLASAPRTELPRLRQLVALEGRVAVVVDGLNEIGIETRADLVNLLLRLRREGECYLLVTDRFGSENPNQPFQHYELEPLAESTVRQAFDGRFGAGRWERLATPLKEALGRPFFLNLALLLEGEDFADADFLTPVFEQFCQRHAHLTGPHLDEVAAATVTVFEREGNVRTASLAVEAPNGLVRALVSAGVLRDNAGFTHDLWRDYFVARRLAVDRSLWGGSIFDLATGASAAFESLRFAVEQIASVSAKDDFLTEVFDWNWLGALECLAGDEESLATGPSSSVRLAIIAAAAERRFDPMQRTARRAGEYLARHRYTLADRLRRARDRGEIVHEVLPHDSSDAWFKQWKQLFTMDAGDSFPATGTEAVRHSNSLVGWAAANAIYRARADDAVVAELDRVYEESGGEQLRSVRWRVVHALGRARGRHGVEVLLRVLEEETDDWVLYGVVRSLVIQAALDGSDRERILAALQDFVGRYEPARAYMRTRVLEELIEAAFVSDDAEWRRLAVPLAREAAGRVDSSAYEAVAQRVEEFATQTDDRPSVESARRPTRVTGSLLSGLRRILRRRD